MPHGEGGGGGRGERGGRVTVSSAYHEWPTLSSLAREVHRKKPLDLTNFKFENKTRTTRARFV